MSSGAATDGVTLFSSKKTDDLFSPSLLESDDLFSRRLLLTTTGDTLQGEWHPTKIIFVAEFRKKH